METNTHLNNLSDYIRRSSSNASPQGAVF